MQRLRSPSDRGFTLIEFAIILGIIGVLTAFVAPSFQAYARRKDARRHVQRIASVLQEARSQAVRQGNNFIILFDSGAPGQIRLIDDDDNDWQEGAGEVARVIGWQMGSHPGVTSYANSATPPAANAVPEDGGGAIPAGGTSFPIDAISGLPAVGFTPQGVPVDLGTPANWGSGAGTYYITDSVQTVYAATLLPLGGVRVRVFRPGLGDWI